MKIIILGGGPAGYEAALVAGELGADVTVVNDEGPGGNSVLWDCVPSKTLISSAEALSILDTMPELGIDFTESTPGTHPEWKVDLDQVVARVKGIAGAQSADIGEKLEKAGVRFVEGTGRVTGRTSVEVALASGRTEHLEGEAILFATGSDPLELPTAKIDGDVILNSHNINELTKLPERLIVVGAGATGAEYANAFQRFGSDVTFVCTGDRVLPKADEDAAMVVERAFANLGMDLIKNSRAAKVERSDAGAVVHLVDGRRIEGSHVLMAIGQVPQSAGLGLAEVGVQLGNRGAVVVDGVSRTNVHSIYAAGDVTGRVMLASVAAMQARIAMWHVLGQPVTPLRWDAVAECIFTVPQIATVGMTERHAAEVDLAVEVQTLQLRSNARAKMSTLHDGFVKLLARPGSGTIVGGLVVAQYASDLISSISVAVFNRLTAAQLSQAFQIYPSFTGSVAECGRLLAGKVRADYRF